MTSDIFDDDMTLQEKKIHIKAERVFRGGLHKLCLAFGIENRRYQVAKKETKVQKMCNNRGGRSKAKKIPKRT